VEGGKIRSWTIGASDEEKSIATSEQSLAEAAVALVRNFEFKLPLTWLLALPVASNEHGPTDKAFSLLVTKLRLRFSLWHNHLPVDALPLEGWIELQLLSEEELISRA
jgi:hypothetical protein